MVNIDLKTNLIFLCCMFFGFNSLMAQSATITLGKDEVPLNREFTIAVKVNGSIKSCGEFPEIPGFRKFGTSTMSTTEFVNGAYSRSESREMSYQPIKQGVFVLPAFSIEVNGQKISSPGKKIKVAPAIQQKAFDHSDLFDQYFQRRSAGTREFVDIEDDAFFALTTSKNEVYLGEPFTMALSFFVAEQNRAPLKFKNEIGQQLNEILKELRPKNCWEENFNIEHINGEPITINGKSYTQFKIYEGTFYPLIEEDIYFKKVGLEMIKYKVAKNPSAYGSNRLEDYKTFSTRAKTVRVKPLPEHPLKGKVAVGQFRLEESLSTKELNTGDSFIYDFDIYGEGNISGLKDPEVLQTEAINIYPPDIQQEILRRGGRVTGVKSFRYHGMPREPGNYAMKDLFSWVYFDPVAEQYDTLKPKLTILVNGESKQNEAISANDLGSFYDTMGNTDNTLKTKGVNSTMQLAINLLLLVSIITTLFVVVKKTA